MNKPSAVVQDEESDLVAGIRGGDESAFGLLYLAHTLFPGETQAHGVPSNLFPHPERADQQQRPADAEARLVTLEVLFCGRRRKAALALVLLVAR